MSLLDPGYEPPARLMPPPPASGRRPGVPVPGSRTIEERRRDRALELAVAFGATRPDYPSAAVVEAAERFEAYLRGADAAS